MSWESMTQENHETLLHVMTINGIRTNGSGKLIFFFHSLASFFHFCLTRVTIWTQQAIPNKVFIGKTNQKKKKHFTFLSRENKDHQACLPRALADLRLFPRPILSLFPSVNRRLLHWGKTDLFPYCNLSPPFYIHKRSYLPLLL